MASTAYRMLWDLGVFSPFLNTLRRLCLDANWTHFNCTVLPSLWDVCLLRCCRLSCRVRRWNLSKPVWWWFYDGGRRRDGSFTWDWSIKWLRLPFLVIQANPVFIQRLLLSRSRSLRLRDALVFKRIKYWSWTTSLRRCRSTLTPIVCRLKIFRAWSIVLSLFIFRIKRMVHSIACRKTSLTPRFTFFYKGLDSTAWVRSLLLITSWCLVINVVYNSTSHRLEKATNFREPVISLFKVCRLFFAPG